MHSTVTFRQLARHLIMNSDKFHQLILPMKDKLFRLALSIVREQADAEDIVQDVLLKLWKKREEWSDIDNYEAYCFRAVKNLSFDRLASAAIRKTDTLSPEQEGYTFIDTHSPYKALIQEEERSILYKCIDELPENQKLVFQLREIEEMSYKEIASTLNISEDLVKISLFRARKKLKELLSGLKE